MFDFHITLGYLPTMRLRLFQKILIISFDPFFTRERFRKLFFDIKNKKNKSLLVRKTYIKL